jgi:hypothetical protein
MPGITSCKFASKYAMPRREIHKNKQLNERRHMLSFLKKHEGFIYEFLMGAFLAIFVIEYFTT